MQHQAAVHEEAFNPDFVASLPLDQLDQQAIRAYYTNSDSWKIDDFDAAELFGIDSWTLFPSASDRHEISIMFTNLGSAADLSGGYLWTKKPALLIGTETPDSPLIRSMLGAEVVCTGIVGSSQCQIHISTYGNTLEECVSYMECTILKIFNELVTASQHGVKKLIQINKPSTAKALISPALSLSFSLDKTGFLHYSMMLVWFVHIVVLYACRNLVPFIR